MKKYLSILGLSLGLIFSAITAQAQERAGTVKAVNGPVMIERASETLTVNLGDAVFEGDRVKTEEGGFVALTLRDQTRLTAGPNSELVIDRFSYNTTTDQGELSTRVDRGRLAVISGRIAKANPDAVRFNTRTMTLGVRGTEFIIEAAE